MVRMANVYAEEGSLENAFILYMKFMTWVSSVIVHQYIRANIEHDMNVLPVDVIDIICFLSKQYVASVFFLLAGYFWKRLEVTQILPPTLPLTRPPIQKSWKWVVVAQKFIMSCYHAYHTHVLIVYTTCQKSSQRSQPSLTNFNFSLLFSLVFYLVNCLQDIEVIYYLFSRKSYPRQSSLNISCLISTKRNTML